MLEICLDAGSTHNNKKAYALELINMAEDIGADYIKFQLFPNTPEWTSTGNVHLNPDLFLDLYSYCKNKKIKIAASAFDKQNLDLLATLDVPFIKFAYSQKENMEAIKALLEQGKRIVVSCDEMSNTYEPTEHEKLTKLYCISQYPVPFQIDFVDRFPPFDGFSDHTIGYHQTMQAVAHGAEFIEKHIRLEYSDITCPDSRFALTIKQAGRMIKELRGMR